jgi:hypothetical protein
MATAETNQPTTSETVASSHPGNWGWLGYATDPTSALPAAARARKFGGPGTLERHECSGDRRRVAVSVCKSQRRVRSKPVPCGHCGGSQATRLQKKTALCGGLSSGSVGTRTRDLRRDSCGNGVAASRQG